MICQLLISPKKEKGRKLMVSELEKERPGGEGF